MSGCPHAGGHRSNSDLDLSSVALASPFAAQYGECKRVVNMTCERIAHAGEPHALGFGHVVPFRATNGND